MTSEPSETALPSSLSRRKTRAASSQGDANRTSNACQTCRYKKVKCSGERPCTYCAKRRLRCVFTATDRKRLFSISEVRDLQHKLAFYERQQQPPPSEQLDTNDIQQPLPHADSIDPVLQHDEHHIEVSDIGNNVPLQSSSSQTDSSPAVVEATTRSAADRSNLIQHSNTSVSRPSIGPSISTPLSALSSSDHFGLEVKNLLTPHYSLSLQSSNQVVLPSPLDLNGRTLKALPSWPTERDSFELLDTVVFYVGISQQLFDVRVFSDQLSLLSQNFDVKIPQLWAAEILLVFAIGRLLQARPGDVDERPDATLFHEAMKYVPNLSELRNHGLLAVEVLGLAALYLQIVDRREDAYLHISTALRLAIMRGMHRSRSDQDLTRSESIHAQRLWWSIYLHERRLAAAGGFPMAIRENMISAELPGEILGYSPVAAIRVNVKVARIMAQVTSRIYSESDISAASFVPAIQEILSSLYDVESTMPGEYHIDFDQNGLMIAGRPFVDVSPVTARTGCSLYLAIYQTIIYTVRPVLLHIAKVSLGNKSQELHAPGSSQTKLAIICIEAARKSLVLLQNLKKREIIAKHAFLDLDAVFSVAFVFVLAEATNPGKGLGLDGIQGSRSILQYLTNLGNKAAGKRLHEVDQMCSHLSLPLSKSDSDLSLTDGMSIAEQGRRPQHNSLNFAVPGEYITTTSRGSQEGQRDNSDIRSSSVTLNANSEPESQNWQDGMGILDEWNASSFDISHGELDSNEDLYWLYRGSGSFTGVEHTDWEIFGSQLH